MKDLIIDCFAGGGGASVGIEMALGRPEPGKTEKKSSDLDGQMDIRDFL